MKTRIITMLDEPIEPEEERGIYHVRVEKTIYYCIAVNANSSQDAEIQAVESLEKYPALHEKDELEYELIVKSIDFVEPRHEQDDEY